MVKNYLRYIMMLRDTVQSGYARLCVTAESDEMTGLVGDYLSK